MSAPPRFLHLQSTFSAGGKELRTVQIANALGAKVHHTVVSAEPGSLGAADRFDPRIPVDLQPYFPPLKGRPTPARLQRLARAMRGYDLVLTYNWGAMDAVMAHTLFKDAMGLPPLIHHEDGFDELELNGRKLGRNWYRRIALGKTSALIVPSLQLEEIALTEWQQPLQRVKRISNGIDTAAYGKKVRADAIPRLLKQTGEHWVGTLAGLRTIKNLPRLVRAFAATGEDWHLVICGEGDCRDAILAEADSLEINHRVHLPGTVADPAKVVGLFDIFALSSDSEQFPISVVEAMAAGLPVAAPPVGDIPEMVAAENRALLPSGMGDDDLGKVIAKLAGDAGLRKALGKANRDKARASYDAAEMVSRYRRVYETAMRRDLD